MELRSALKLSAGAHGGLVVWALVAGWFSADFDDAMEVTEVSLISGAEFAALVEQAGSGAPAPGEDAAPEPEVLPTPEVPPQPRPETASALETAPAPEPEPEPQVAAAADAASPAPTEAQELSAEPGDTPTPAPRVAPRPADRPEPNAAVAPETIEAAEPVPAQDDVPEPAEALEPAAPEEATTRIVTEATQVGGAEQIALAPAASQRPRTRPSRPEPVPEPEPAAAREPEPEVLAALPEPPEPAEAEAALDAAVADALADALAGGGALTGDPGQPMTSGERDALRLAVQECWVVDVGSEAASVTVVVGVSMTPEGQVANNEVRMLSATGGSETATRAAYDAARRAILRCQRGGYNLPPEKYAQWQEIEMVFNPSDMRIR